MKSEGGVSQVGPQSAWWLVLGVLVMGFTFVRAVVLLRRGKFMRWLASLTCAALCAVLLFAVQTNRAGDYARSWGEAKHLLVGTKTVDAGGVLGVAPSVKLPASEYEIKLQRITNPGEVGRPARGEYYRFVFTGPQSQLTQPVRVWLPNRWKEKAPLRVVVMLHGYPANPAKVFSRLHAGVTLQDKVTNANIMLVMPEHRPDSREPDCVDFAGRPKVGTWIARDVVEVVKHNFPVSNDPAAWTITGVSAGGYCAGVLGALTPQTFGNIAVVSGYDPPLLGALRNLTGAEREEFRLSRVVANGVDALPDDERGIVERENDEAARAKQRIYSFASGSDGAALEFNQKLSVQTQLKQRTYLLYQRSGGHNWDTWDGAFAGLVKWIDASAPAGTAHTGEDDAREVFLAVSGPVGAVLRGVDGLGLVPFYVVAASLAIGVIFGVRKQVRRTRTLHEPVPYWRSTLLTVGAWLVLLTMGALIANHFAQTIGSISDLGVLLGQLR